MQVIIAHSNKHYIDKLKKKFFEKGVNDVYTFNDGFGALAHIIKNHSKLIIIEENLPHLNASDIKKALIFKGIKSKFLIVKNERQELKEIEYILSLDYNLLLNISVNKL